MGTAPNPMGRSRGAKIKSLWRQPCGAPPLRSWPAPVGSVPAGQPVRRAAWAAPAAIPVGGRTRSFGEKPTALCQRLFSPGLVCLPSMRAHHAERHTRSATHILHAIQCTAHIRATFTRLRMPCVCCLSLPQENSGARADRVRRARSTSWSCRRARRWSWATFCPSTAVLRVCASVPSGAPGFVPQSC